MVCRKEQVKSFVNRFLQEKEKAARGQETNANDAKKHLDKWKKRLERFQEAESYKPASHRGQYDGKVKGKAVKVRKL